MKVVLDTHILVAAANDSLSAERKKLLTRRDTELLFSAISLWEIAKLIQLGRLVPDGNAEDYLARFATHPRYTELPLSPAVLAKMIHVAPLMHKDPADQLIVATALLHKASLMSDDRAIVKCGLVRVV